MRLVDNMSITVKSLVAPVAGCLMILVVAGVFANAYFKMRQAAQLSAVAAALHDGTQELLNEIANGHGAVFRAVSWKQAMVEAKLVATAIAHSFNYDRDFHIPAEAVLREEDSRSQLLGKA